MSAWADAFRPRAPARRTTWMSSTPWSTSPTRYVGLPRVNPGLSWLWSYPSFSCHILRLSDVRVCLASLIAGRPRHAHRVPQKVRAAALRASVSACTSMLVCLRMVRARRYELPILAGREPDATESAATRGAERAIELSKAVDPFILRRTNALLSAHLPPKARALIAAGDAAVTWSLTRCRVHVSNRSSRSCAARCRICR